MSNIYIQEPPALGKVLLKTSVGDIDLELWTKEAPKACRNFLQLCMEGYYNGTIFHRIVPDFIVQGGDPNGDGTGGESIYGAPFKDEFHSRLRFNRRGLVAMANAGKDDNGSQFFFTLNTTPELQNKHTIFAKVTGETVFNMMKLAEGLTDQDDRPLYPSKIISTEVLVDPFGDIVPRVKASAEKTDEDRKKKKKERTGVKNFGLLSFGGEAEEEEDQSTEFSGKPKSTHDLLDDPKLSRLTAQDVDPEGDPSTSVQKQTNQLAAEVTKAAVNSIRDKLQAKNKKETKLSSGSSKEKNKEDDAGSEEEIEEYYLGKDRIEARKKQAEEIRGQIRDLKREMSGKKNKETVADVVEDVKKDETNEMVKNYEEEQEKYKKMKEQIPKKGQSRETQGTGVCEGIKPWVKNLYENTAFYPDNYTDVKFLEQMRKNINPQTVTFLQSFLGSCRVTQKLSTCVLFSVLFTYLYNEWLSTKIVFGSSCVTTATGYLCYLLAWYRNTRKKTLPNEGINKLQEEFNVNEEIGSGEKYSYVNSEESFVNEILEKSMSRYLKRQTKKESNPERHLLKSRLDSRHKRNSMPSQDSVAYHVFSDLKTVLIFLVFGFIVSPILHTLTDTVSTDTIFAMTTIMMIVHLIFSDYGISVSVVSKSLSINAAIFGSICLASRLSTSFHAFVLITVAVQCFVLFPILISAVLNSLCSILVFSLTTLSAFVSLWYVSKTMFCIFLVSVLFLNVYCPILFVRWQKYKDNIYGPWDEAVVHDSDDIEECIGIKTKSK